MNIRKMELEGEFFRVQVYEDGDGIKRASVSIIPEIYTGLGDSCLRDGLKTRNQMITYLKAVVKELDEIRYGLEYAYIHTNSPWSALPKGDETDG